MGPAVQTDIITLVRAVHGSSQHRRFACCAGCLRYQKSLFATRPVRAVRLLSALREPLAVVRCVEVDDVALGNDGVEVVARVRREVMRLDVP